MPHIRKEERYVRVAYDLMCGYERATALADDVNKELKEDRGLHSAKDDTRGWDGDRMSCVVVTYDTLADAVRLDPIVRQLLSRKANFTYEPIYGESYGSTRAYLKVNSCTSLTPINST